MYQLAVETDWTTRVGLVIVTELGVAVTDKTEMMWEFLSILGSHDLSAMREIMECPKV